MCMQLGRSARRPNEPATIPSPTEVAELLQEAGCGLLLLRHSERGGGGSGGSRGWHHRQC